MKKVRRRCASITNVRKGNKALIKDLNRYLVLEYIRQNGQVSRTAIAKATKMGLSTVTNIVEELLQAKLVHEVGTADSTGGRKAVLLEFNKHYSYTFGVKIEEEQVRLALTNLCAEILDKRNISFEKGSGPAQVISLIVFHIKEIMKAHNLSVADLSGIGIASSGLINRQQGTIVRSSILGWENISICRQVSEQIESIPVYLDKNINAYTLAELSFGFGKQLSSFVCLSVGAGLGMTTVINGEIYSGSFGGAGEFGHTIVQMNGHLCHCGQQGCLEMYASEAYLQNEGPFLKEYYPHSPVDVYTFKGLREAVEKQDPLALELMKRMGVHLGFGIVNIINSLNPSIIVLMGEGLEYAKYFLPYTLQTAQQNYFAAANLPTEIVVSQIGNDSWLKGAALLAIRELFRVPIYSPESIKGR
ncbi:MAG: ROK family protein [Ectobacillus sp.]